MSKADRDTQLRRGQELLMSWQLSDDAGVDALRNVMGRDVAADLAIAVRLGGRAEPASAEALRALEAGSQDKLVRKEVRRSLYRLEQRGIAMPQASTPTAPLVSRAPVLEGYLSAVDGRGDQLVWLAKPRPGGLVHLFAVINDPDGLRELDLVETTRKALRAARHELEAKHDIRMIEADWRYCDHLIDRAFHWAAERGQSGGDYPGIRAQLIKEPVAEMPPLIRTHLDAAAIRAEPHLLAESELILAEKEFRTWFFDHDAMRPYVEEILQTRDSPLVLNDVQRQERFRSLTEKAIEELFGGERCISWVRRLQEMAYFFHATGRGEQAKRALAAALALEGSSHGGGGVPFCEQLTRSSLVAFLQVEEEREKEESRSSLVVTPQQAAREAQRRR